eukprot:scaffold219698_cov49-Prasinocladus_malaysianus.AAC.1
MDTMYESKCGKPPVTSAAPAEEPQPEQATGGADGGAESMETDAPAATEPAATEPVAPSGSGPEDSPQIKQYKERFNNLRGIITGKTPIGLYLEFLYSHNRSDLQVLKNIKSAVESRNSVCHSAAIVANALMHSGTTVDTFLRDNLDWLSRATNWAKFTATAGLGVIHKGHLTQGKALMEPYLPGQRASASPYSEGGALYALGLIHANHGDDIRSFLLDSLRQTSNELIQHGACLGLGLASMGTEDEELFEDIKGVLYTDSAVAGEAAGIAMGLLQVRRSNSMSLFLRQGKYLLFSHSCRIPPQMTHDQDSILRYGGMFVIAMAYTGTANNAAIQKLLHFAVSDVSNDVRRAAVMCLGFVLAAAPEQCPSIVSLLAESFNPHVRYGAAMAVGIACSGTGFKEAVSLLEPLLTDATDFVRQGALLAMAFVLMEQPESRVASFRKHLDKVTGFFSSWLETRRQTLQHAARQAHEFAVSRLLTSVYLQVINDKHEEVMCKMGAILASGIIDAGGRNVTVGLRSRSGQFRMTSAVGLTMFLQ